MGNLIFVLQFLLIAFVLVYSSINLLRYARRRLASKRTFKQVLAADSKQRTASDQELAHITEFLHDAGLSKKMILRSNQVSVLNGYYVRHGIQSEQGDGVIAIHHTIAEVEVLLPYDAEDHLLDYNEAEVVFTQDKAIVIALNNTFDLASGRQREALMLHKEQQWEAGAVGPITQGLPGLSAATDTVDKSELHVELLGRRLETPAEAHVRVYPEDARVWSLLSFCGFLLFLSFIPDALFSIDDTSAAVAWVLVIGLGLGAVYSLWGIIRARDLVKPLAVNVIKGKLVLLRDAAGGFSWLLGDKLALTMPSAWMNAVIPLATQPIELEVRVYNNSVLRVGQYFSVDEELRRFPIVYWGRLLSITIVCGAVLVWVYFFHASLLRMDAIYARAWFGSGRAVPTYTSVQSLQAAAPTVGALVKLEGVAKCTITQAKSEFPAVDCRTLHWDGEPVQLDAMARDKELDAFAQAGFIKTRPNSVLSRALHMKRYQEVQRGQILGVFPFEDDVLDVLQVGELIAYLDNYCTYLTTEVCTSLRQLILNEFMFDVQYKNWPDLQQAHQSGEFAKSHVVYAHVSSLGLKRIKEQVQTTASMQRDAKLREVAFSYMLAERGGVLLDLQGYSSALLPQIPPIFSKLETQGFDVTRSYGLFTWLAQENAKSEFSLEGLVVAVAKNHNNTPIYSVLLTEGARRYSDAIGRLLMLGLLFISFVVLGVLSILRLLQARRRAHQLQQYQLECAQAAERDNELLE